MKSDPNNRLHFARRALIGLLLWLGLWACGADCCWQAVFAQQSQPAATAASANTQAADNTVELSEVAERLNDVNRLLRGINDRLTSDDEINAIADTLSSAEEQLADKARATENSLAESLTLQEVSQVEAQWRTQQDQFERWIELVTRRAKELESNLQQLDQEQQLWEETFKQNQNSPGLEFLLTRITNALSDIRKTKALVQRHRQRILIIQNNLAPQELLFSDVLDKIELAKERLRRSLLTRDSPLLWQAWPGAAAGTSFLSLTKQSISQELSNLKNLIASKGSALILLLLFYLGAAGLAYVLSKKVSLWREGKQGVGDSAAFHHSPMTIAMVAATLCSFWLPALAPVVLSGLVYTLLFLSLIVFLAPLLPRLFRPLLYVAGLGHVLYRIRGGFQSAPVVERTISTIALAFVIGAALWLLRPARWRRVVPLSRSVRACLWAIWGFVVLLAVTLLANVFGYVALSRVIGRGAISSLTIGIILYGSARVLNIVFSLLLQVRWFQSLASVRLQGATIHRWFFRLLLALTVLLWALATLRAFTITDEAQELFNKIFRTPLEVGALSFSLWDGVAFIVVILGAFAISKAIRFFLQEDVLPKVSLQRGLANAILSTIQYGVLFIGFLLAMGAAGLDLTKFTVLAGAFGVGIGFGLQNIFNNFISGLILLYERPIQLEDMVEIGGVTGTVKRIGIRSSTVRTFQGADVIVPNSNLISNQFTNWTYSDQSRRLEIKLGVAYDTDLEKVLQILTSVGNSHPKVLKEPAPIAVFRGFGDSTLDLELRLWVFHPDALQVESELGLAINAAMNAEKIEIPFPQRDVHVRSMPIVSVTPPPVESENAPATPTTDATKEQQ